MGEKKVTRISLSTFFLILAIIIIIIMAYYIYKLNNEKNTEIGKVADLNNQVSSLEGSIAQLQGKIDSISNTIRTNSENNAMPNVTSNIETKKIILEGHYVFEDADVGYEFDKNGNVSINGDITVSKGTYATIGENEIKITLTESVETDIETGKTASVSLNETETIKIVDENTLLLNNADGKNQKLVKYTNN